MRVLKSWLQDYITFSLSPEAIAERLTMLGLEFESVEDLGKKFDGFVVGRIVERDRHPNADRLSVCKVDVGGEILQIVCGAPNVAVGQKVAVGRIGATVPHNQHDANGSPFVLSKVSIRGVESSGMICSSAELGLGDDSAGILVLDGKARTGQPLAKFLGVNDVAFDVEITPNRPDWLSHIGVAREIGVLVGRKPVLPKIRITEGKEPIGSHLRIRVEDKENCTRFAARMIKGVSIGPSPEWLQRRLRNAGLRPRNNVVDVTNYVMLECGHPLHAFDHALLRGGQIVVRQAKNAKRFTTLDGKEHDLPPEAVMVCDAEREVSIAGVMGGGNSEINDTTVDVVLESAHWKPSSIRRTAKTLGISSDASQRFERGTDPNGVGYALDRAAAMICEFAGGTLLRGVIDVYPRKAKPKVIAVRPARVSAVLGVDLDGTAITKILALLNIKPVKKSRSAISFRVPTYRVDIEKEIDLVEEIARVYGYDNIPAKTTAAIDFSQPLVRNDLADRVRAQLAGMGFHDVLTNSMQDESRTGTPGIVPVRVLNPLSKEMGVMRTSVLHGLLDVVAVNQNRGNQDLRLFEIGHVFRVDAGSGKRIVGDVVEEERLGIVICGSKALPYWGESSAPVDVFDLKGLVSTLLSALKLDNQRFIPYSTSVGLIESPLVLSAQGVEVGYLGKVFRETTARFGVEGPVFAAEFSLQALHAGERASFVPLPRFPIVRRDIALIVDRDVPSGDMIDVIQGSAGELLVGVDLFDQYEGKGLPEGKKSLAFALALMSRERTLTDADIEPVVARVVREIEQRFHASLRGEITEHAQH